MVPNEDCHAVPAGMPLNARGEKRAWEPKQAERTALDQGEGRNSRLICFVRRSSGSTLMETFGAWDRSQQQKQPPGLVSVPPTLGLSGCWLQARAPKQ